MTNTQPYTMCSERECRERLETKEISLFEKTNNAMDPCKMVAKYRRSAAGMEHREPRTCEQLEGTVSYLRRLLMESCATPENLVMAEFVTFLEDRIRAVQVDYTMLCVQSKKVQFQILQLHILLLYLMSEKESKMYERKFSIIALQTALSNYWIDDTHDANSKTRNAEVLSFSILIRLNEYLVENQKELLESNGSLDSMFGSSIWWHCMLLLREHYQHYQNCMVLQWTLSLLMHVANGRWQCALTGLQQLPTSHRLTRCCVGAGMVSTLRLLVLQRWNRVVSKNQAIPLETISQSLVFSDTKQCRDFINLCGLPFSEDASSVIFKATELQLPGKIVVERNDVLVWENEDEETVGESQDGIVLPSSNTVRQLLLSPGEA